MINFLTLFIILYFVVNEYTGAAPSPTPSFHLMFACSYSTCTFIFMFLYFLNRHTLSSPHPSIVSTSPCNNFPPPLVPRRSYRIFQKRSALLLLKMQHGNKRPFGLHTVCSVRIVAQNDRDFLLYSLLVRHMPSCQFPQIIISLFILEWFKLFFLFLFFYFFSQNHPT